MTSHVLFVGSAENRSFIMHDSDDDMPVLVKMDGTLFDQDTHPTDLEKHKDYLFSYIKYIIGDN